MKNGEFPRIYCDSLTLTNFRIHMDLINIPESLSYADLNINNVDLYELQELIPGIEIDRIEKSIICSNHLKPAVSQLLARVKLLNFPLIWYEKFRIA